MAFARIAELGRRGVVAVGGAEARKFLGDLVTADIETLRPGKAAYGGLLTPQGKIIFDFIVFDEGQRFLFDLPKASAAEFAKRLVFYRLRAKVDIADLSGERRVVALWDSATIPKIAGTAAIDPRLAALGSRAIVSELIVPSGFELALEADYDAHRAGLGVPEGGIDFAYGENFPHDVDMDQLGGIDFKKGCYVGQEVVSRMEHRGTARRRFVVAQGDTPLPRAGTEVTAGGRALGTLGSGAGATGIALVRLDRAKAAMDAGTPILAGDAPIALALPAWAHFGWPADAAEAD